MNYKLGLYSVLALSLAVGANFLIKNGAFGKYEEPSYRVLDEFADFEVREYNKRIVAEVEVAGPKEEALNTAFKILAGYIFGKNVSQKEISMTAPVAQSKESEKIKMTTPVAAESFEGKWKVKFFMPKKYSLDSLPKPVDESISLKELDSQLYAVKRFSGSASKDRFEEKASSLVTELEKSSSYEISGSSIDAYYNPPFTPPFLKRNEVMIPVVRVNQ